VCENLSIEREKNLCFFIIFSLFDNPEENFGFHYQLLGGTLLDRLISEWML